MYANYNINAFFDLPSTENTEKYQAYVLSTRVCCGEMEHHQEWALIGRVTTTDSVTATILTLILEHERNGKDKKIENLLFS